MKKDLGNKALIFPMPVLMIATYDENGVVDVMNAAWGTVCDPDVIALNLSDDHKTTENIMKQKAFTVALADAAHIKEADFFGIASGNKIADKFERTGYHAVKSEHVNAPIIEEFPLVMECELAEVITTDYVNQYIGKVINTKVNEEVLDEKGKVDPVKLNALMFDTFQSGYYTIGEKAGQAWNSGAELIKK